MHVYKAIYSPAIVKTSVISWILRHTHRIALILKPTYIHIKKLLSLLEKGIKALDITEIAFLHKYMRETVFILHIALNLNPNNKRNHYENYERISKGFDKYK